MYKIKQIPEDFKVKEIADHKLGKKGKYQYFLLTKKDYTTEKAIRRLADYFNMARKNFSYAGIKDRHGITTQYVSVLGNINEKLPFENIQIEKLGRSDEENYSGNLKANEFEIVVRNISKKPKPISQIINYFDDQRFGFNNVEVGKAMLKKDWKNAATKIKSRKVEEYLEKNNTDYIGAIRELPFKIQKLYIHAFQSWLWNGACKEYIIDKKIEIEKKVEYKEGEFLFPKENIKNITLPLISFDTEFEDVDIEKIYMKILKENNLSLRDFVIRSMPQLTPTGSYRDLITEITKMRIQDLEEDELNKGKKKLKIKFRLPKGSYATLVIKRLFN